MREWIKRWLGLDELAIKTGEDIGELEARVDCLAAEVKIRLDENRFLSRKLDMLSQGVVPKEPEIFDGQDGGQEC